MGCGTSSLPEYPYDDRPLFNSEGELIDNNPVQRSSPSKSPKKKKKKQRKRKGKDSENPEPSEPQEEEKEFDMENGPPNRNSIRINNPNSKDENEDEDAEQPQSSPEQPQSSPKKSRRKKSSAEASKKNEEEEEQKSKKPFKNVNNIPGLIDENIIDTPSNLKTKVACVQTFEAHTQAVTCIIEMKNKCIASSSLDKTIKIWKRNKKDIFALKETLTEHTEGVLSLKEIPELEFLCSCSIDCTTKLWDTSTFECITTLSGHTRGVLNADYSPKYQTLATSSDDSTIIIWNNELNEDEFKEERKLTDHSKSVATICYIDAYGMLCSGSDDMTIKFWNIEQEYICVKTINTIKSEIDCVKYAKNRLLASCEDGNVYFINMKILKRIRSVQFSPFAVHDFFVFNQEKFLAVASNDCTARIWKIGTGERTVLKGHTMELNGIILLHDDKIASCSADKTIKIWEFDDKLE